MSGSKKSIGVPATEIDARCLPSAAPSHLEMATAIIEEATRSADLVCDFLDDPVNSTLQQRFDAAPAAQRLDLLLRIAAMLQIEAWERSGIRSFLGLDLPYCAELRSELAEDTESSSTNKGFTQMSRILGIWLLNLAWQPYPGGRAPVALRIGERRDLVDQLAGFMWKHRHLRRQGE